MLFTRRPRQEGYQDTARKRAAFKRKQEAERNALPLFANIIAAEQHSADEEMARRTSQAARTEHDWRDFTAKQWREVRARYYALPSSQRSSIQTTLRHNYWGPPNVVAYSYLIRKTSEPTATP